MGLLFTSVFIALLTAASGIATQSAVAPTGTLRAVYLSGNPAQAVKEPATGAIRGVVVDLTREWGRRLGVETALTGVQSPQHVIDAVRNGQADIGFVAYNPERAGPVELWSTGLPRLRSTHGVSTYIAALMLAALGRCV